MTENARITICMTSDGELNIYLNEAGRDKLVGELEHLSRTSDHVHLNTFEGAEVELSDVPYHEHDRVIHAAKISLRPDEWDRQYFPHVMSVRAPD